MTTIEEVVAAVEAAFADTPRPSDAELLHPDCADDMDLEVLYGVPHWRDLDWPDVVAGYSAMAFLSPEGFRHFVAAYLSWVARNPDSGEAVVDSTVWAFHAEMYEPGLRDFVRSHWAPLDEPQRAAVGLFLSFMADHHPDAAAALASWLSR